MIKHCFLVYKFDDEGKLVPHDHPVFTGDIAYDLAGEQEVQVCPERNVREFMGHGEVIAAINDYARLESKETFESVGSFVIVEHFHADDRIKEIFAAPKKKKNQQVSISKIAPDTKVEPVENKGKGKK